jgi:hypothetical protein
MAVYNPTAAAPYVEGSPNYSLKRVSFRCQFVTDAAPDQVIPAGACTTPVRTSEGLYTLVIPNFLKNGTLVSAHLTVLGAAGVTGARVCQVVSYVASTGVLTFQTADLGATPAVADVANDEWVMFDLCFAQDVAAEGTTAAIAA